MIIGCARPALKTNLICDIFPRIPDFPGFFFLQILAKKLKCPDDGITLIKRVCIIQLIGNSVVIIVIKGQMFFPPPNNPNQQIGVKEASLAKIKV